MPIPLGYPVQPQLHNHLSCVKCAQIHFVSEHKKRTTVQPVIAQHLLESLLCQVIPLQITTVNHINDCISVVEVVVPEPSNVSLPSDIPYCELHVLEPDLVHVEPYCWDS